VAFIDIATAIPEVPDAIEILTEVRWWIRDQVAKDKVVAKRVAVDTWTWRWSRRPRRRCRMNNHRLGRGSRCWSGSRFRSGFHRWLCSRSLRLCDLCLCYLRRGRGTRLRGWRLRSIGGTTGNDYENNDNCRPDWMTATPGE